MGFPFCLRMLSYINCGCCFITDAFRTVKPNDNVPNLQVCGGWDSSLWAEDMENSEGDGMALTDEMDCRSHNSSPVRRRAQQRLIRARGALNRSCSVPDSNNPPCLSTPQPHGDISVPISDLTEIGEDEHLSCDSMWSKRLQTLNRVKSCESYPHCSAEDSKEENLRNHHVATCIRETDIQECHESHCKGSNQDLATSRTSCQDLEMEQDSLEDQSTLNHSLYIPNNYMTKSMLCLNEESQDEVRKLSDSWVCFCGASVSFTLWKRNNFEQQSKHAVSCCSDCLVVFFPLFISQLLITRWNYFSLTVAFNK